MKDGIGGLKKKPSKGNVCQKISPGGKRKGPPENRPWGILGISSEKAKRQNWRINEKQQKMGCGNTVGRKSYTKFHEKGDQKD